MGPLRLSHSPYHAPHINQNPSPAITIIDLYYEISFGILDFFFCFFMITFIRVGLCR